MLPGSKEEKLWQMEMALRRRQPLGRQQGLQLVDWAEKVIPGRGKSMEVGSGREIFREAFDLAGGEGCLSCSVC